MAVANDVQPEEPIACGGCRRVLTPPDWYALPFVGRWPTDFGALELRICTCGSCISRARPTAVSGEQRAVGARWAPVIPREEEEAPVSGTRP